MKSAKMGMHFVALGPSELEMDPEVVAYCKEEATKSGGSLTITDNVEKLLKMLMSFIQIFGFQWEAKNYIKTSKIIITL